MACTACVSSHDTVDPFPAIDKDFSRYRVAWQSWLTQRSMAHRSVEDIALNLPFEIAANPQVAYRGRYLLLHGLNDSAYVWRGFARELAERGFDVRAILFAGHGSTPEDMLDVRWDTWLRSARDHLAAWRQNGIPLHVGGFSMGAVLATWLALDNPDIASLFLISPAYESRLNHYLRWSGVYARFRPWVFGGMILEDNPTKYNSIPVNSGWQYYKLTRGLKRRWGWRDRIDIPVLMVMTEHDSVVNVDYTRELFRKRFVSDSRLLLTYTDDVPPHGGEPGSTEVFRQSAFPDSRILNQSHLGLMYPPDDSLFGERGSVLVCNGNEYPIFMACMRSSQHWYGAQHTPSPDGVAVARTTYNPDWSTVMEQFDKVVLSVSEAVVASP